MKRALEEEILTKEELKTIEKKEKQEEKKRKKELKQKLKQGKEIEQEEKLFVLRFYGDLEASEVDSLRDCITAILSFASEKDERAK